MQRDTFNAVIILQNFDTLNASCRSKYETHVCLPRDQIYDLSDISSSSAYNVFNFPVRDARTSAAYRLTSNLLPSTSRFSLRSRGQLHCGLRLATFICIKLDRPLATACFRQKPAQFKSHFEFVHISMIIIRVPTINTL